MSNDISDGHVKIPTTVKFTKLFINGQFVDSLSGKGYCWVVAATRLPLLLLQGHSLDHRWFIGEEKERKMMRRKERWVAAVGPPLLLQGRRRCRWFIGGERKREREREREREGRCRRWFIGEERKKRCEEREGRVAVAAGSLVLRRWVADSSEKREREKKAMRKRCCRH
ncbi:hypothetical protein Ahy_A05g023122 isoform E [Arachis hypogaea]|uniref:Uncharacterized protein n=1 Tax=Arachis hypogaea TaxID=3818 RepID=A0A445D2E9_ARAHY|nr:hypothetical protein Ahy_A05g023122 isoform E [Arachis hypogaea]